MKKILYIIIIFCICFYFTFLLKGKNNIEKIIASDTISVLCEEYSNNINIKEKEKNYRYLEIHLIKYKEKIKWYLNEVIFSEDSLGKNVIISVQHSRSNDDYDLPLIKNIKWIPGEKFECQYGLGDSPIELTATKIKDKKNEWVIYGKMKYKMPHWDPVGKEYIIELKSVKEINLKYKKIRLPNLYYK